MSQIKVGISSTVLGEIEHPAIRSNVGRYRGISGEMVASAKCAILVFISGDWLVASAYTLLTGEDWNTLVFERRKRRLRSEAVEVLSYVGGVSEVKFLQWLDWIGRRRCIDIEGNAVRQAGRNPECEGIGSCSITAAEERATKLDSVASNSVFPSHISYSRDMLALARVDVDVGDIECSARFEN